MALTAASSLTFGLLTAPPVLAHPDQCESKAGEAIDQSEYMTESQIAALDDSSASSPNLRLLSNTPKSGIAAGEAAFNSDLAFVDGYAILATTTAPRTTSRCTATSSSRRRTPAA